MSEEIWRNLEAQGPVAVLRKHRDKNLDVVRTRVHEFAEYRDDEQRSQWVDEHVGDLLRAARSVLAAQQSLLLLHTLRAARLRTSVDPHDVQLAEQVLRSGKDHHRQTFHLLDEALRTFDVTVSLLLEADENRTLGGSPEVPLSALRDEVRSIHATAAADPTTAVEPLRTPPLPLVLRKVDLSDEQEQAYRRRLRWLLGGEPLRLLARADAKFSGWKSRCLVVVTERRMLLIDRAALKGGRCELRAVPLDSALRLTSGQRAAPADGTPSRQAGEGLVRAPRRRGSRGVEERRYRHSVRDLAPVSRRCPACSQHSDAAGRPACERPWSVLTAREPAPRHGERGTANRCTWRCDSLPSP